VVEFGEKTAKEEDANHWPGWPRFSPGRRFFSEVHGKKAEIGSDSEDLTKDNRPLTRYDRPRALLALEWSDTPQKPNE